MNRNIKNTRILRNNCASLRNKLARAANAILQVKIGYSKIKIERNIRLLCKIDFQEARQIAIRAAEVDVLSNKPQPAPLSIHISGLPSQLETCLVCARLATIVEHG